MKYLLFHLWKELVCFNRIPSFTLFCGKAERKRRGRRERWRERRGEGQKKQMLEPPDRLHNRSDSYSSWSSHINRRRSVWIVSLRRLVSLFLGGGGGDTQQRKAAQTGREVWTESVKMADNHQNIYLKGNSANCTQ